MSWPKLLAATKDIERVATKELLTIEALKQLESHIESTGNESDV